MGKMSSRDIFSSSFPSFVPSKIQIHEHTHMHAFTIQNSFFFIKALSQKLSAVPQQDETDTHAHIHCVADAWIAGRLWERLIVFCLTHNVGACFLFVGWVRQTTSHHALSPRGMIIKGWLMDEWDKWSELSVGVENMSQY